MDILFVLVGISIFFTAAAVFALDYAKKDPIKAGLSFALPPYGWFIYSKNRKISQQVIYTQLVGVSLIVAGVVLLKFFDTEQQKFWQETEKTRLSNELYVGSDKALNDLSRAEKKSAYLNGRIHNKAFIFKESTDSAEFDSKGTLRIKNGPDFHGQVEIAIELNEIPPQVKDVEWRKIVREKDSGVPVIYISWLEKESNLFNSKRIDGAYIMDLRIKYNTDNQFFAYLQLVLPDAQQSYAIGDFSVYSSRLRFTDTGLDRTHDSNETLELIAAENLLNTYKRHVNQVYGFTQTDYDYRSGEALASTFVYLAMRDGSIKRLPLQFYKNENGWFLDVKGLQDQLKDNQNLLTQLPAGLRPVPSSARRAQVVSAAEEINLGETQSRIASHADVLPVDEKPLGESARVEGTQAEVIQEAKSSQTTPAAQAPLELNVDLATQMEQIPDLLKPLINKEIEVLSQTGKVTKGFYVRIERRQVVVETEVASGIIEFMTEFASLKQIRVLNDENVRPQLIRFQSPENQ